LHYYQHHIGDFLKATSRLTDAQSMAYLRLLWMYYDSERPLPDKVDVLAFQVGIDAGTVRLILESYFRLEDGAWKHTRCDKEIAEYKAIVNKRSNAGKASAERKKNTSSTPVQQVLDTGSTDVQLTNNHKPITNNQEPLTNVKERERTSALVCPSDVREEVWNDWIALRRQKKAIVTDRVVRTVRNEASKAGMSLDAALEMACARGWQGFSADWIAKGSKDGWSRRMQGFDNTIDMETSNGQVPVLPEDSVPF